MMERNDFFETLDVHIIRYSFTLLKEIDYKIQKKKLLYQKQVWKYVNHHIEMFLKRLDIKESLINIYKREIYLFLEKKLSNIFKKYRLWNCY
jgi:hypothetical protein